MRALQWIRASFFRLVLNEPLCRWWDARRPKRPLGAQGELLAERYLLRQGYFIVGRNHRSRLGEIDLIAVDRDTVVFVEVKTRASSAAGLAAEAVDARKEERLSRTASEFVRHRHLKRSRKRFDVIAIDFRGAGAPELKHYRSAFEYALPD